jgi:(R,R)-butanediol dehydrogenase / meso-butanediol dehydrogenase / diacetyl reductase
VLAAVFEGPGRLAIKEVPEPRVARQDDVLLRVQSVGICGSDLHILSVPPGHPATAGTILGHEYVAEVEQAGPAAADFRPGDRVVIDPNLTCGQCPYCRMGRPNSCLNMTTLGVFIHGGMARYNIAPARALHKISKAVPVEHAVLAEPLSCVLNGVRQLSPQVGESALILGAGPIGLLFAALLRAAGVRPLLVAEVVPYRAEVARDVGADEVLNPRAQDLLAEVLRRTEIGVDMAVDAVGTQVIPALRAVRRGGRVLLFGVNSEADATLHQYEITRNEKRILGSFIAHYTFPQAIRVLEAGLIDATRFITHRIGLRDIHAGLETLQRGEGIKVVVAPD